LRNKDFYLYLDTRLHQNQYSTIFIGKSSINRKLILKKFFFLFIFVTIILAFDGTLAKDIFDYRIQTLSGWLGLILVLGIFLTLFLAETIKSHPNENTHK